MSDLARTLTEVAERGTPIGSARLRERVMLDLAADVSASPRRRFSVSRPIWAFAGAAAVMLVLLGMVPLVLRTFSDGASVTATTAVTAAPTPTTMPPATTAAPQTSTSAPATTAAPTVPAAIPMEWSRVELGAIATEGEMATVIGGGPGFIAGGSARVDGEDIAAVWTSPDGNSWNRVPHDAAVFGGDRAHWITDLAAGDGGFVAVGSNGRDGMVWTSTDGNVWERVSETESLTGDGWINMLAVTYGPGGYVAVGYESEPDNEAMIDTGVAWVSPDGLAWERIDSELFTLAMLEGITITDSGYVAVGLDWRPAPLHAGVWVSPDGRGWSQIDVADEYGGTLMGEVTVAEGSIVAVGNYWPGFSIPEQEGDDCIAIWLSDDVATWTRVPISGDLFCARHGADAHSIAASGDRIVIVGTLSPESDHLSQGVAWVSSDAGSTWEYTSPAEVFGVYAGGIRDIVAVDGLFIAVGDYDDEAAIWTGVKNEEDGS